MAASPHVYDVAEADFAEQVLRRSAEVPVVVDFWAPWCGPCRVLGPILEEAVAARDGAVVLAKVDTDANPSVSMTFNIRTIPAVKAFRDGRVVDEFTGALPPGRVEAFLDGIVPTEADRLAARARVLADQDLDAAIALWEQALAADAHHLEAGVGLAAALVGRDPRRARDLVGPHRPDPRAEEVLARLDLAEHAGGDLDALRAAVDGDPRDGDARLALGQALAARGEHAEAFPHLLEAVKAGGDARELAREQVVAIFSLLGPDDELVRRVRPRLAAALH